MIQLPEGSQVVRWCSLFCTGNQATGDLNLEEAPGTWSAIPICDYCKDHIEANLGKSIDTLLGDMIQ